MVSAAMGGPPGSPRIALFGCPLDTGNLGVSALGLSTIDALSNLLPAADFALFDNSRGVRRVSLDLGQRSVELDQRGAWVSRRLYRSESLWLTYAAARTGIGVNGNLKAIDAADAVLDISGGDSFSDIYGEKRFAAVQLPKRIALLRGRPLVLLPQTYGPFGTRAAFDHARTVVCAASEVWARDELSFERLQELAGTEGDPARLHQGVDVAFGLPSREPVFDEDLGDWFEGGVPVAGINVSGLLYRPDGDGAEPFGLRADYAAVMRRLVDELLAKGVRVLLVPHVRGGSTESDDPACRHLFETFGHRENLRLLPPGLDASETKWVISRMAWFTGARMHATIAALSSLVPSAVVAYSDKARGVFASCGVDDQVFDARERTSAELLDALRASWHDRSATRERLSRSMPSVLRSAAAQAEQIARTVEGYASAGPARDPRRRRTGLRSPATGSVKR
jgi:colanic acid/amylovoran biosynthesis protein